MFNNYPKYKLGFFFLLVVLFCVVPWQFPQQSAVALIFNITTLVGSVVSGVLLWTLVKNGLLDEDLFFAISYRLLKVIFFFLMTLFLLGKFGDQIYNYIHNHPHYFGSLVGAGLLVVAIVKISNFSFKEIISWNERAANYNKLPSQGYDPVDRTRRTFSPRDRAFLVAHEVGHALLFSALRPLPPKLVVCISKNFKEGKPNGYVSFERNPNFLLDKNYAEWFMLVLLAGFNGEQFRYNNNSLGASDDLYRWGEIADLYCRNVYAPIFYDPQPVTPEQKKNNADFLEQLKARQTKLINEFFELNNELFQALEAQLSEQDEFIATDLESLFQGVRFPPGFPHPEIEFD